MRIPVTILFSDDLSFYDGIDTYVEDDEPLTVFARRAAEVEFLDQVLSRGIAPLRIEAEVKNLLGDTIAQGTVTYTATGSER